MARASLNFLKIKESVVKCKALLKNLRIFLKNHHILVFKGVKLILDDSNYNFLLFIIFFRELISAEKNCQLLFQKTHKTCYFIGASFKLLKKIKIIY